MLIKGTLCLFVFFFFIPTQNAPKLIVKMTKMTPLKTNLKSIWAKKPRVAIFNVLKGKILVISQLIWKRSADGESIWLEKELVERICKT